MISQGVSHLIQSAAEKKQDSTTEHVDDIIKRYSQYLLDLGRALNHVDSKYYDLNDIEDYDKKTISDTYERMFAYELYHQLRRIIGEKGRTKEIYDEVILNGEMGKTVHRYKQLFFGQRNPTGNEEFDEIVKRCFSGKNKLAPDLLLHEKGSVGSKQVYLVEIKMSNNDEYHKDFVKLTRLKDGFEEISIKYRDYNNAGFNFYIFIYEGNLYDKLCRIQDKTWNTIFRKFKRTNRDNNRERIDKDIVCYFRVGKYYKCATFGEIALAVNIKRNKQNGRPITKSEDQSLCYFETMIKKQ